MHYLSLAGRIANAIPSSENVSMVARITFDANKSRMQRNQIIFELIFTFQFGHHTILNFDQKPIENQPILPDKPSFFRFRSKNALFIGPTQSD